MSITPTSQITQPLINQFPNDVFFQIFKYIDVNEYPKISLVCKRWREALLDEKLWDYHCRRVDLSQTSQVGSFLTWKNACIRHRNLFTSTHEFASHQLIFPGEKNHDKQFCYWKLIDNHQLLGISHQYLHRYQLHLGAPSKISYLMSHKWIQTQSCFVSKCWILKDRFIVRINYFGKQEFLSAFSIPKKATEYVRLLWEIESFSHPLKMLKYKVKNEEIDYKLVLFNPSAKKLSMLDPLSGKVQQIDTPLPEIEDKYINNLDLQNLKVEVGGNNLLLITGILGSIHSASPRKSIFTLLNLETNQKVDLTKNEFELSKMCLTKNYRVSIHLNKVMVDAGVRFEFCVEYSSLKGPNKVITQKLPWPDKNPPPHSEHLFNEVFKAPFFKSVFKTTNWEKDELFFGMPLNVIEYHHNRTRPLYPQTKFFGTVIFSIKLLAEAIIIKEFPIFNDQDLGNISKLHNLKIKHDDRHLFIRLRKNFLRGGGFENFYVLDTHDAKVNLLHSHDWQLVEERNPYFFIYTDKQEKVFDYKEGFFVQLYQCEQIEPRVSIKSYNTLPYNQAEKEPDDSKKRKALYMTDFYSDDEPEVKYFKPMNKSKVDS
jgi:hypothetical protein